MDGAAVLQASGALGEALAFEAIDEAGDVGDADDHHLTDLVAEAAGLSLAPEDAEDVVGTSGKVVGLEEALKGFGENALGADEVEVDLLLDGLEAVAFSEFGLERRWAHGRAIGRTMVVATMIVTQNIGTRSIWQEIFSAFGAVPRLDLT